jgi:REP element-mobilizing transposase RayT
MPRKARIDARGALHHIIIRGIERKAIFKDRHDRDNFIKRLGTIITESSTSCYAWTLMTNHVYLAARKLMLSCTEVARELNISPTAVSRAANIGRNFADRETI